MRPHLLVILLFSAFGLAACSPPNPSGQAPTETQEDLQFSNSENYSLQGGIQNNNQNPPSSAQQQKGSVQKTLQDFTPIQATEVTLKTTKGDITFSLYRDEVPLTTGNFLDLASQGFYDGIVFHRVIPGFMAQVGDPLTKDPSQRAFWGTGDPGYTIADEFHPNLKHDGPGMVSMANSGPNTGGSQFFITYDATPWLDGKHAVFGRVTGGMDVLEQIGMEDTIVSVSYR